MGKKKTIAEVVAEDRKSAAEEMGRLVRPRTREELRDWVEMYARMKLPERGVCVHHNTPLDYLDHVFFERGTTGDTVVWACRGGGKTMIGAVATLLDLIFKPGIQVKILGGSKEQSERMYTYLCSLVTGKFSDLLRALPTRRGFSLANGSRVEILTQSQTSVRGTRVQKMRCDEVELFDEKVWDAAQLTTRAMLLDGNDAGPNLPDGSDESKIENPNPKIVRGAVEVFSTLHRPSGLMSRLVAPAARPLEELPGTRAAEPARKVFTWCIWDVVGKCEESQRACEPCVLREACGSRARRGTGFVPIVDVLAFHQRATRRSWENEMLCEMPYPEHQVFGAFRSDIHVRVFPGANLEPAQSIAEDGRVFRVESLVAGIDYGWQKFVCLWLAMLRDAAGRRAIWVLDEYVMPERALEGHAAAILARSAWKNGASWNPAAYYGDVAGRQHDAHTGMTSEALLRGHGIAIKSRAMKIEEGIAAINRLIDPPEAWGKPAAAPRFFVDPRCPQLIAALGMYVRKDALPLKDGEHDHFIDALRYAVAGHDGSGNRGVTARIY